MQPALFVFGVGLKQSFPFLRFETPTVFPKMSHAKLCYAWKVFVLILCLVMAY